MADLDKFVKLLGQTDGRDKIYKALAGLVKVLAACSSKDQAKLLGGLGKSIGEGRSIMRLIKWVGNIQKLNGLLPKLAAPNTKNIVETIRVIGDFGYIFGDNVQYLSKYKVLSFNAADVARKSKVFQFWGYIAAVLLDIFALQAARAKAASDKATADKEIKAGVINVTKNLCDTLVVLATVGYLSSVYKPSAKTTGALTLASGAIATYQNWNKLK